MCHGIHNLQGFHSPFHWSVTHTNITSQMHGQALRDQHRLLAILMLIMDVHIEELQDSQLTRGTPTLVDQLHPGFLKTKAKR